MIRVSELEKTDSARWDRFVYSAEDATFFHLSKWREIIESAFGHKTHYLYAENDGDIVGVLPLAHVKSLLFGRSLVSLPFCVYGGPVVSDERALAALLNGARSLARELSVNYLGLRCRRCTVPDWPTQDLYVTFRRAISHDPDENMRRIPRKQRAMIRKGIALGLESTVETSIDRFFRLYAESYRNLGTPSFSKRYFRLLKDQFGKQAEILIVTLKGRAIAAVLSFYFRDEVLPYYFGGIREARDLKASDFLYWELMRLSAGQGVRVFDYGRSRRDTGSYHFKKHWGFEAEQLYYHYDLVNATSLPNVSPSNPKYRVLVSAWKRLPIPLARWIGPPISRHLG